MNPFKPSPWLRSFSWKGFFIFVGFAAALSVWSWSGVLFANKTLTFRDEAEYLVSLFQRNLLNYFPAYFLVALVDGTPLRGVPRRVALTLALAAGIALAVQARCAWANQVFYVYEGTLLPYCTAFPTWRTYVDFPSAWISALTVAGMVMICVFVRRRDTELVAALHGARATELESRRQRIESDIEAMQSRVDPDRLLETMRTIRARYETSLAEGEAMLEALIVDLRRAARHPSPEAAD
jgi:hypothetical protein